MTYRYNTTSIYGITTPEPIKYGDGWIYGAVVPNQSVAVPTNVYVLHEYDYNIISWENSGTADVTKYVIYKSNTYGHNDAIVIAVIDALDTNGKIQTCYIDYLTDAEIGNQYYYSVQAVNNLGEYSFKSEWNADINQVISNIQYSYLYTDNMTQTYWNTLDLYKQLGNFDTDRNVIPFRDLGVEYKEKNGVRVEEKKNCNYLYATILSLNDTQASQFNNLNYSLYMDDVLIATNKPNITTAVYVEKTDESNRLQDLAIEKDTFISYFMTDTEYGEDLRTFTYVSKIENPDGKLRVLAIDREKFFKKILVDTQNILPSPNNGDPNIYFDYIGKINNVDTWTLNIPANNIVVNNVNVEDYGITYSSYSTPVVGNTTTRINVSEYWKIDSNVEEEIEYVKSDYKVNLGKIALYDTSTDNKFYGITYNYNILENGVSFTVDFNKKSFVYFRVPYIYNSKILKTYIIETGVTGNTLNRINFKTYNYLIFPSVIGKIFNQQNILLRQMKGNLYKTDVTSEAIYRNFGSYFNFEQPSWMGEDNYRACVLGSESIAGLLTAGMNGGTLKGVQQAINSYSQGLAQLTDQSTTKYLEIYDFADLVVSLPTVTHYTLSSTPTQESIVCVFDSAINTNNYYNLIVANTTPSDVTINLIGNSTQTGNQINVEQGYTALDGNLIEADYILTDCVLADSLDIDPNLEVNYYMYVTNSVSSAQAITISDDILGPSSPSADDYWFNTNNTAATSYKFKTLYKYNGTAWTEYTSNILCSSNGNYYYYIASETNKVKKGLYQLVTNIINTDTKYFINVNTFFKNKKYSTTISNDSRIAIMQLNGTNWVTVGYDVPSSSKTFYVFLTKYTDWVIGKSYIIGNCVIYNNKAYICTYPHTSTDFEEQLEDEYWLLLGNPALSYTHNYIINTWNLTYSSWIKNTDFTKYVVYGNTIKLNDNDVIDNSNFMVKDYTTENLYIRNVDYIINDGYITWINYDNKPADGSYILISYDIDTRKETMRLVNLIKYPQVHINYIWE